MKCIGKSIGAQMKSQKCECNYMLTDREINDTFDEPENNRFVHIVECPKCGKIKAYFEEKVPEAEEPKEKETP
jgi:RNase P subunit RPR2